MLADSKAKVSSVLAGDLIVKDYFTSVLGAPALNMGVFVGIITGFLGATLYNKYYNYNKLPQALAFFNGKRFVPFVVIVWSTVTAIVLSLLWPFIQSGLNEFGRWIAASKDSTNCCTICIWNVRAFTITIRFTPYVNNSDELY